MFERRRLYNVAVSRSRHPGLNEYIRETIHSLAPWIEGGKLEKLAVLFIDANDRPVERLVFQVKVLKEIHGAIGGGDRHHRLSLDDLEHMLRAMILKIQVSDAMLSPLPDDCRFELLAYSWSRDERGSGEVWVDETSAVSERNQIADPKIVPIKSLASDFISLQIYAECPK